MTLDNQFNTINDKLQQLLRAMNRLKKENEKLRLELDQSKLRETASLQQIDELQQQAGVLKMAAGEMNETDKKNFEKKLSQYIKEVDKCIAFLSK